MYMKTSNTFAFYLILGANFLLASIFLTGCGDDPSPAQNQPAVIEESEGGLALIEREFGECDPNDIPEEDNPRFRAQEQSRYHSYAAGQQYHVVTSAFPHEFNSLEEMYPNRGSWRQSKDEIMDIVDRYIYDPQVGRAVPMLKFFDMVLMINVADRQSGDPSNSSAQRMQVYVRSNSSHFLEDWDLIKTWPISSGNPCGEKIATPTGVFKLDPSDGRFTPSYFSRQFDNVDMFETMFLYHAYQDGRQTGVAIHGTYKTSILGRRDSGGCIRLYRENSQCLFNSIIGEGNNCLGDDRNHYMGQVPSFLPRNGEAEPEYLSSGALTVSGIKVLVAIYDDKNDRL